MNFKYTVNTDDPEFVQESKQLQGILEKELTTQSLAIDQPMDFTLRGFMQRLVLYFTHFIKFARDERVFYVFTGKVWKKDRHGDYMRYLVFLTYKSLAFEYQTYLELGAPDDLLLDLSKWQKKIEDDKLGKKYYDDIHIHYPIIACESSLFDQEKAIITCKNGTVDLRTRSLKEGFSYKFFSTRYIPYNFRLDLIHSYYPQSAFMRFIHSTFSSDIETIQYIQTLIGYSLSGVMTERLMVIFVGEGKNGKSVLMKYLLKLFPGLVTTADCSSFLDKKKSPITSYFARLQGYRIVGLNEPEEGDTLSAGKIKEFTSGDQVVARFLRENEISFRPEATLIMLANYLPEFTGEDKAMTDRIKVVRFPNRFEGVLEDKTLEENLDMEIEKEMALTWFLVGGFNYFEKGCLPYCQKVVDETNAYHAKGNSLEIFLLTQCEPCEGYRLEPNLLKGAYLEFCHQGGAKAQSPQKLSRFIQKNKHFTAERKKYGGGRYYFGIRLKNHIAPIITDPFGMS